MFSFFDAHAAKEFGSSMARFYIEHMPRNSGLTEKQFATKSQKIFDSMGLEISVFKRQNKLNTYKVAHMSNAFKWVLKEADLENDHVNNLTQWFVLRIQSKPPSS